MKNYIINIRISDLNNLSSNFKRRLYNFFLFLICLLFMGLGRFHRTSWKRRTLNIFLSVYLSTSIYVCHFISICLSLPILALIYLLSYHSGCISFYLSSHLSVCISFCLICISFWLSLYLSVCLSII